MKRDRDSLVRLIAFALLLNAAFLGMRCSSSSDLSVAEADSPELLARVDALEDGLADNSELIVRVAALEASVTTLTQTVSQMQGIVTGLGASGDANAAAIAYLDANQIRITRFYSAGGQNRYLQGSFLSDADLRDAYLEAAFLRQSNLEGANLQNANLTGADLEYANLTGANLMGANLTGASCYRCDFAGADLTGANVGGVDFREARGLILQGTIGTPAQMP